MFSGKETKKETRANFRTTKDPPRVKKSPLPALGPGSLLLAGAIKSLSSTDGVENPERCGARDARDLSGLPRAGGAQGTQGLLGQRPAEDDAHGQAQLSTAGYSPQPPAGTDPTFPTPSLCPRPGHGGSAPKACRRPPTRAIPTQSTPRLRLETAPRGTIPKCMRPGGRGRHPSRHREQSSQSPPLSPRVTACQQGRGTDLSHAQPRPARPARAMPTQRGRARHPPGPARSGLLLGLVARGCDGPARCRLAGAAATVSLPRAARPPRSTAPFLPPRPAPRELRARGRQGASAH